MASTNKIAVPSVFSGKAWQQVLARDTQADGQFVYAVKTTKVFCRPSCPSRRPERKNVSFFPSPELARTAGFRACLLCKPDAVRAKSDPQIAAIEAVSSYLTEHAGERTRLIDVSSATGVAPLTILRGFKRVLGVTPREFARARRVEQQKNKLRASKSAGNASISGPGLSDAGMAPANRLDPEDAQKDILSATTSAMQAGGKGETIRYAIAESALGPMLVGATTRGLCAICFADEEGALLAELRERYPLALLQRMDAELSEFVGAVAASFEQRPRAAVLPMDVRGTAFQLRIWQELQAIPRGETRTYKQIAEAVGQPDSVRAVARAIAANPLAVVVPCHRVLGSNGSLTGYRWGLERKRLLLEREGRRG